MKYRDFSHWLKDQGVGFIEEFFTQSKVSCAEIGMNAANDAAKEEIDKLKRKLKRLKEKLRKHEVSE